MVELQVLKRKNNKKLYKLLLLFFLVFAVFFLIKPTWNIWRKKVNSDLDLKEANNRFESLKEREGVLNAELKRIESQIGQEEEIVRKFDVVREGEELAVILEAEEPEITEEPEKGFFAGIFDKMFGWLKD